MKKAKKITYIYSENTFDYNKHGIVSFFFCSCKKMVNIIFADKNWHKPGSVYKNWKSFKLDKTEGIEAQNWMYVNRILER